MSAVAERFYALRRAVGMLARQPGRFLLAVALAAAAMALPLMLAALALATLPAVRSMKAGPEISIFVKAGSTAGDLDAMRSRLASLEGVASVRVITRDQALTELSKRSSQAGVADTRSNPLPDTLVARFPLDADPTQIERAADAARQWAGVDIVQADIDWFRRLVAWKRAGFVAAAGAAAVAALLVVSALLGAALLVARPQRDEIRVLQCVGARPSFVRRPHAYAAAIALALGAALACVFVRAAIAGLGPHAESLGLVLPNVAIWWSLAFAAVAAWVGGAVGAIAAWAQMRRHSP
ncbi:MAG TPA: permease-like cell division protein FtsX [Burkholderiaceae bacterium]|nr:permease-like cell division protein FtsX [Burkholderiaceae bacterium]HQR70219.1 permease-like cell division protein FtsX [Burkholderiaceae bacterium]